MINLLPWREIMYKQRKKRAAIYASISLFLMLAIVLMWCLYLRVRIRDSEKNNSYIKQQISVLNKKYIKVNKIVEQKAQLMQILRILKRLQIRRLTIIKLFPEIVNKTPFFVTLTKIVKNKEHITIEGKVRSTNLIAEYLVSLEQSAYLSGLKIQQLHGHNFIITAIIKYD